MDDRKRSVSTSATSISFNHTRSSSVSSTNTAANTTSRHSLDSINSLDDLGSWQQPSFYQQNNSSSSSTIVGAHSGTNNINFNKLVKTVSASSNSIFTKNGTNSFAKLFSRTNNHSADKLTPSSTNNDATSIHSGMSSSALSTTTSKKSNSIFKLRKSVDKKRPELSIQTNFHLNDSPMKKTSKELERIASINSPTVGYNGDKTPKSRIHHVMNASSSHHHHHHHNFLRPRKDNLSSSNSNSHITNNNGTIYNFHPSNPSLSINDLQQILNQLENDVENLEHGDREQKADDAWSLLCSLCFPLFRGQPLKIPIEDLNKIVLLHLSLRIQEKNPPGGLLNEYMEFLQTGLKILESSVAYSNTMTIAKSTDERLANLWTFFHNNVLYYLEGIFQPLNFQYHGGNNSTNEYHDYMLSFLDSRDSLAVRRFILTCFRDTLVIPSYDDEFLIGGRGVSGAEFIASSLPTDSDTNLDLLQCLGILNSIQSGDTNQHIVERQFEAVKLRIAR